MSSASEDELLIRSFDNPYPHVMGGGQFEAMLIELGHNLKILINEGYEVGKFKRPSLGLCLMNPAKPARRGTEAVLALFAVGPEGKDYLVNAVAKAVTHHNTGQDCGIAAYVEPYRLPDGSFVYGHSTDVAGTIAGASGLSEAQDRYVATLVAAEFNLYITEAHIKWREQNPDAKWYCNLNTPLEEFSAIAALIDEDDISLGSAEYVIPQPSPGPHQHD